MLRVVGHTILQIANFRITCFSFFCCRRISTMALAPNNGHGNGNGNPNRNLLLQLGFENPDPVHDDGMSWARNLHDEVLSDVAPGGLSYWEIGLCRVFLMAGGAPNTDNFAAMADRIKGEDIYMSCFIAFCLFCPSIYHAVMVGTMRFQADHPGTSIDAALIMGLMFKFTGPGWFGNHFGSTIRELAIQHGCRVVQAMLATGRHPTVPLASGGRMAADGALPNLDPVIVTRCIAPPAPAVEEGGDEDDEDGDDENDLQPAQ